MAEPVTGRFSTHFEYGRRRSVPIERFPFFRAAVATDPLEIAALDRPQLPDPPTAVRTCISGRLSGHRG